MGSVHMYVYRSQTLRMINQISLRLSPKRSLILSPYVVFSRVTQIKTYSWDNAQVILVGNKCDMEDERIISYERGKQLADQLGVEFFETSAKENINVKAVFVSQMPFLKKLWLE